MNPSLRDIVKQELQKLLDVNFIYLIYDSGWLSPLAIVPNKNEKRRIFVDYRELNKATQKNHFPSPFINEVLDTLSGKKYFSFLDGFNGNNQIKISPKDQNKMNFTFPWGTFSYHVLPFGICNAPATFQWEILCVFTDLVNDSVKIYMDDFTPYGTEFEEAISNIENTFQ
jgi:hypothetical protein